METIGIQIGLHMVYSLQATKNSDRSELFGVMKRKLKQYDKIFIPCPKALGFHMQLTTFQNWVAMIKKQIKYPFWGIFTLLQNVLCS